MIEQIKENIYLQYFVGLSSFQTQELFDASLMVSIRKRLGQQVMEEFNKEVLKQAGIIQQQDNIDATKPTMRKKIMMVHIAMLLLLGKNNKVMSRKKKYQNRKFTIVVS